MLETYNLMEAAILSEENLLDDDVLVEVVKKAVVSFIKRAKFTETLLVPSLDAPDGVIEVKADEYLDKKDEDTFKICISVVPYGTFISEDAWKEISNWLEWGAVRKVFMINNYKCHILKADLHNDIFVCLTLEQITDTEVEDQD